MIRILFCFSVLISLAAQLARAADPPPRTEDSFELTYEAIATPPPRQITFERKDEPHSIKLSEGAVDRVTLQQKFVAVVMLVRTSEPGGLYTHELRRSGMEEGFPPVQAIYGERQEQSIGRLAVYPPVGRSYFDSAGIPREWITAASEYFQHVLDQVPEAQQPPAHVKEFFLSEKVDRVLKGERLLVRLTNAPFADREGFRFRILAPDEQRAEQLAAGLIQIMDWGVSRPIQLSLWKEREAWLEVLNEVEAELRKAETELAKQQTQLENSKDINAASLNDLRTQQWLLQVDIAGLKARIQACDRLLKGDLPPARSEQVLDLKIAAEIELAGLSAKKTVLEEFVAATTSRRNLEAAYTSLRNDKAAFQNRLKEIRIGLERTENSLTKFGPLPLLDNKVLIQPIEWSR